MLITMTNKETGKEINLETSSLIVLQKALGWLDERNQSDDVSTDSFLDSPFPTVQTEDKKECDCPICTIEKVLTKGDKSRKEQPSTLPRFLMSLDAISKINE